MLINFLSKPETLKNIQLPKKNLKINTKKGKLPKNEYIMNYNYNIIMNNSIILQNLISFQII